MPPVLLHSPPCLVELRQLQPEETAAWPGWSAPALMGLSLLTRSSSSCFRPAASLHSAPRAGAMGGASGEVGVPDQDVLEQELEELLRCAKVRAKWMLYFVQAPQEAAMTVVAASSVLQNKSLI